MVHEQFGLLVWVKMGPPSGSAPLIEVEVLEVVSQLVSWAEQEVVHGGTDEDVIGQMGELVLFFAWGDVQVDVWEVEGIGHPFIDERGLKGVRSELDGRPEELQDSFGGMHQSHKEPFFFFLFVWEFPAFFQINSE